MTAQTARYQAWLHREIPLTADMGLELTALAYNHAATRTPLARNHNVHGTGFAGSLYAQAMLTGWILLTHYLEHAGLDAVLVQREGTIRYRAPVTSDPVCRCSIEEQSLAGFCEALLAHGKARITADIAILSGEATAATLTAEYSAHLKR